MLFITQNLYHKGKEMRDVSLNSQYLFIFKNRLDMNQIIYLGRQLYPNKSTKKLFYYLLVDLKNETVKRVRLGTQILPGQTQYMYEAKKGLKGKTFAF